MSGNANDYLDDAYDDDFEDGDVPVQYYDEVEAN